MIIYVIRHTPVDVPSGTCYGFSDVSLSDDWRDHATRMKRNIPLEAITPVNVYTSPLSRCSLLSRELTDTPREDERLKEMNYAAGKAGYGPISGALKSMHGWRIWSTT